MKNPVPFTKKSIAQGRDTFLRNCVGCHGDDGKALIDVVANATDLTDPKAYRDGTTDGEIFRSIRDGAGASMPSLNPRLRKTRTCGIWSISYIACGLPMLSHSFKRKANERRIQVDQAC